MFSIQRSGAAEILRAAHKDVVIKQKLEESLSDLLLKIFGTRKWLKHKNLLGPLASFVYYSSTTLCGLQTLGEEYTGILQVDHTLRHVPGFIRRLLLVLFDSFGYYSIINLIGKLENGPTMLAIMQGLHRSVFFLQPVYYDVPKRLTNIKYVLIRSWLRNESHVTIFRIVGLITLLTSLLNSARTVHDMDQTSEDETSLVSSLHTSSQSCSNKCTLCLEDYKNISVTNCGHLFCWHCIHLCVQNKRQCPVCREPVQPNRIVMLQNFTAASII